MNERVSLSFFLVRHSSCRNEPIFFYAFHAYDLCFFRRKETTRTDRTHSRPSPRVVLPTNRAWIANSSKTTLLAAKKTGPPRRVVAPMFASIELGGIKKSTKQTVLHSLQMKRASRNSTTNWERLSWPILRATFRSPSFRYRRLQLFLL